MAEKNSKKFFTKLFKNKTDKLAGIPLGVYSNDFKELVKFRTAQGLDVDSVKNFYDTIKLVKGESMDLNEIEVKSRKVYKGDGSLAKDAPKKITGAKDFKRGKKRRRDPNRFKGTELEFLTQPTTNPGSEFTPKPKSRPNRKLKTVRLIDEEDEEDPDIKSTKYYYGKQRKNAPRGYGGTQKKLTPMPDELTTELKELDRSERVNDIQFNPAIVSTYDRRFKPGQNSQMKTQYNLSADEGNVDNYVELPFAFQRQFNTMGDGLTQAKFDTPQSKAIVRQFTAKTVGDKLMKREAFPKYVSDKPQFKVKISNYNEFKEDWRKMGLLNPLGTQFKAGDNPIEPVKSMLSMDLNKKIKFPSVEPPSKLNSVAEVKEPKRKRLIIKRMTEKSSEALYGKTIGGVRYLGQHMLIDGEKKKRVQIVKPGKLKFKGKKKGSKPKATHKMPNGKEMTGKTHSKSSKPVAKTKAKPRKRKKGGYYALAKDK